MNKVKEQQEVVNGKLFKCQPSLSEWDKAHNVSGGLTNPNEPEQHEHKDNEDTNTHTQTG